MQQKPLSELFKFIINKLSDVATAVMRSCRRWKPTIFIDTPGFGFGFGVIISLDRFVGVSIMIATWDFCIGFRRHDAQLA